MTINTENQHVISAGESVLGGLERLNTLSGRAPMTLFVVDGKDGRMVGTLTDGDVRRALLEGVTPADNICRAMHANFSSVHVSTLSDGNSIKELQQLRRRGITLVPVLDSENRLIDIINLDSHGTRLPLSAILMAGGKGERLRPLTNNIPKPLLEIEGKAIIDYNIEALAKVGISDITVATGYLATLIHDHFREPVSGVQVKCVTEDRPLGTVGAATLVNHPEGGNTLIMNSDLITTISFEDMFLRHTEEDADITVAVVPYQVSVPFAILETDGSRVLSLQEKPSYSYFANAGIYIVRNCLLDTLPPGERTDATDFIEQALTKGARVVHFPINGTWLDVGSHADFAQACQLMRHYKNMSSGH